jgi:hypothetical protein
MIKMKRKFFNSVENQPIQRERNRIREKAKRKAARRILERELHKFLDSEKENRTKIIEKSMQANGNPKNYTTEEREQKDLILEDAIKDLEARQRISTKLMLDLMLKE